MVVPFGIFQYFILPSTFPSSDICTPYCKPINYLNPAASMYPSLSCKLKVTKCHLEVKVDSREQQPQSTLT